MEGTTGAVTAVKFWQNKISLLSSPKVILLSGLTSKILSKIWLNESDKGRMLLRNLRSFIYARYVESSQLAFFHGLRPQVRFTKMTPRDQTSLGAHSYQGLLEVWS